MRGGLAKYQASLLQLHVGEGIYFWPLFSFLSLL